MPGQFTDAKNYNNMYTSDVYNVNTSHPLIPSSQEYLFSKKYISIHSQDRDATKYPNSADFEIELPQDYLNVTSLKLYQWTFPANYNVFSSNNNNVLLFFKLKNLYNPSKFNVTDDYNYRIFEALFNSSSDYNFVIEDGFYNPDQMTTELTNKFNDSVSQRIIEYFKKQETIDPSGGWDVTLSHFVQSGGYDRFVIVYNNVSLKLWFGNRADGFEILNQISEKLSENTDINCFYGSKSLPDYSSYGLPGQLGLSRRNQSSVSSFDKQDSKNYSKINNTVVPRFYYGDVNPGDNGYWLLPLDLSGCDVHWIEAVYKLNIMGEPYLYMEIDNNNCLDETKPYNISKFTSQTNQTNGVVNSAFAKIAIPCTPLSQWFGNGSSPYKLYYPPAERIRRLRIRIRYHNGKTVNFGVFNYSFMLEFTIQTPQIIRSSNSIVVPPAIIA